MVAFETARWQRLVFALPFLLQPHNALVWEFQISEGILARAQRQWGFRAADPVEKNLEKQHSNLQRREKGQ